jgi:hypothetical protein
MPPGYCECSAADLIAYRLSPIAYRLSPIAYCLLPIAYCLLPIAYCLLPIAYCLLLTYCYPSKITIAIAVLSVCVSESDVRFTPNFRAISAATPERRSTGLPPGAWATSISFHITPWR